MMHASTSVRPAARHVSTAAPTTTLRRQPGQMIQHHAHRRCVRAFAAQPGPIVQPGPPPAVALVTFTRKGAAKPSDLTDPDAHEVGIVEGGQWLWPIPRSKYPRGMTQLVAAMHAAGGTDGLDPVDLLERERAGDPIPLTQVDLLAPIPNPPSLVCVGKNYLEHVGEVDTHMPGISKSSPPALPIIFTKAPTAVTGPGGGIVFPAGVTHEVDYEGELGVVIGKGGKAIAKEDAFDHVFGYTVINDVTARDVQKRHQQWYLGKSFDGFAPCGPWIVPKRALVDSEGGCDPQKLLIGTTVNGDRRQGSDTGQMIFDIRTLIETVSRCMTLRPGDIIATGTPAGVGAGMDPKGWLKVGDVCEVTVSGVGTLSNPVVDWQ